MTAVSNAKSGFFLPGERETIERFLAEGYLVLPVEDRGSLDWIRERIAGLTAEHLGEAEPDDPDGFLNTVHERVAPADLNDLRLQVIRRLNAEAELRPRYFSLVRGSLECLVGNELCMQRKVNLSIQLPDDDSSLLPIHGDVLNGDSPFEVVQWTPFVDVYSTKSMFILPPARNAEVQDRLAGLEDEGNTGLMAEVEGDLVWLDIPYGHSLVFNQNLLHGNIVNTEGETRWSTNCRYKGVFTPYADKKLGEFFEPITLRAASRMGLDYRLPEGFRAEDGR